MKIRRLQLLKGASEAAGVAVVVDVLRASSTILTMFSRGARSILPVATVDEARRVKVANPDFVLAGERGGAPPSGFDLGNSPTEAAARNFHEKDVVLTTSAGSKGLVAAAESADEVVVGCFLNAAAIVAFIQERQPNTVSLVALGTGGEVESPEDTLAAEYLHHLLEERHPDFDRMRRKIHEHPQGQKFLDVNQPSYPVADLGFCLRTDVFRSVPRLADSGRLLCE